jgi:hypothetical protein
MQRDRNQQGQKTHEQFLRTLEGRDDVPKEGDGPAEGASLPSRTPRAPDARASEFPVSRRGMHQESRGHNKHNHPGQSGHKPQKHSLAEEKQ